MYFYEVTANISEQVGNPTVVRLHEHWVRLRGDSDEPPPLQRMRPEQLPWYADDLMLLDHDGGGDFTYRYPRCQDSCRL